MTQTYKCSVPVSYLGTKIWSNESLQLWPNETFTLIINYPFGGATVHSFAFKTGKNGMGIGGILNEIGKAYNKIYESEESMDKYGVFGHGIEDLHLCEIKVNFKTKKITIGVDS